MFSMWLLLCPAPGSCNTSTYTKHNSFNKQNNRWARCRIGSPWKTYWCWLRGNIQNNFLFVFFFWVNGTIFLFNFAEADV